MYTVIYFHGFASVGDSEKSRALRARFGDDYVKSPDLPICPQQILKQADQLIRSCSHHPIVLVGTSLGGFWANYLAHKYDAPCVLVNPCVSPSASLRKYLGREVRNYRTGELLSINERDLEVYADLEQDVPEIYNGYSVNLFVARDDEVLNYKDMLNYYEYTRDLVITDTGGHRYEQHWPRVMDRIARLTQE